MYVAAIRVSSLVFCFFLAQFTLVAAQPWDEPFAGPPATIVKAAAAVPVSDAEVVLLLEDHRYAIQKDGKSTSVVRRVYRIVAASALEDWSSIEQEWEPWHESKPEVRARVLSPDGAEHWLDGKTIADAPAAQLDASIFSDARVVRAPLPAVSEGAVVEYEIVKRDTAPLFPAGVVDELTIGAGLTIERFHVSIDAAKGVPLHTGSSLLPASAIVRTDSKSGTHVEVEAGRREPEKDFEYSVPLDQPQYPSFRFSTGTSWQKIATAYQQIVSERTGAADAKALLNDFGIADLPTSTPPREIAERLTAQLHQRVRYTGVEFGQAAIVPNPPRETIARHYGDCKDKATLLVTLLRAAGLDAHLALLRAGETSDIDPELPGFGLFNHAIVFVGGKEPLWIDATAENARIGTIPIADQGRRALVVDDSTLALTTVPESKAMDNRIIHDVEVRLNDDGRGAIRETAEAYGSFELQLRSVYGGDDRQSRAALERFAKNSFGGKSLGEFSVTKKADFSHPFRLMVEAKESAAATTGLQDAFVRLSNSFLFDNLPFGLVSALEREASGQKLRKHDFLLNTPYHAEVHFKIYPPAGFSPNQLPAAESARTQGIVYSANNKRNDDGTIQLDFQFETRNRRLTPDEFEALRTELSKLVGRNAQVVTFTYKAADLVALGKTADALRIVRKDAVEHPDSALRQMRLAQFLMNSGAENGALIAAKRAVEVDPKSARARLILAYAYEHDSFGRLRMGDWKRAEAEKALRKAVELDEPDLEAAVELAILLEHNAAGERYASDARVSESVTLYQRLLKKAQNPVVSQSLTVALMHLGRYREAQEEVKKVAGQFSYGPLSIALSALTDGPDNAILGSQNAFPENIARAQNLVAAANMLNQLRNYAIAEQLFRAAQRLNGDAHTAQMAAWYGKAKPYEKVLSPEDDPKSPVQRFLVLASKGAATREEIAAIVSKRADIARWQERIDRIGSRLTMFRMALRSNGGTSDTLADLLIGHSKLEMPDAGKPDEPEPAMGADKRTVIRRVIRAGPSGNPAYLVTVRSEMNLGVLSFFVVREDGRCRLIGMGDGLESIGRIALDALAKGDLRTAQQWLDAVKDNALPESPRDDKGPVIRYLWAGIAPETRNAAFARAAAASLIGTYAGAREAVTILKEISQHPPQYMDRDDLTFAICETLEKAQDWEELRVASGDLLKSKMYKEPAMRFLGEALMKLRQWRELAKAAEEQIAVSAKNHSALQFAAIAAMIRGDFDAATKYLARSKEAPYRGAQPDSVLQAWNGILAGKVSDEVIADLDGGNFFSALSEGSAYAYTLALAQLRNGKLDDCNRSFTVALGTDQKDPSGLAWLVHGEIMKSYSLEDEAGFAFDRARSGGGFEGLDFATVLLRK